MRHTCAENSFWFGSASRELGVRFGKFAIATGHHHHKQKALRERKGKTRVRLARRYRPVPVPPRSAGGIRRFAREWVTYRVISAPSRCRGRWGGGSEEGGGRGQKFWLAFRCCWFFACVFLVDRCKPAAQHPKKWQRIARETLPIPATPLLVPCLHCLFASSKRRKRRVGSSTVLRVASFVVL